jgi:predicted Holliday junction resolvase-like endonuclease
VEIATLRDIIIIIYGIVGIILAIAIFVLFMVIYRKGLHIMDTVAKTTAEAKEVIGAVKEEFIQPISKIMVIFQAIKQTATLVNEIIKKREEESHE